MKEEIPFYWWTNIAVPEYEDVRVLAPSDSTLYINYDFSGFDASEMPYLPTMKEKDASYPVNFTFSTEFYFQCGNSKMSWEAALDKHGKGFIEISTPMLSTRKLFCWGNHEGGKHWQAFLSEPGKAYIEIQAGLTPTQQHGLTIPGNKSCRWTELFGYFEADPQDVHNPNWQKARTSVEKKLHEIITPTDLNKLSESYQESGTISPIKVLHSGSGWGAIELERRKFDNEETPLLSSFYFPKTTIGEEEKKWLQLLNTGVLPSQSPEKIPGEWMIDKKWMQKLDTKSSKNWYELLHLGVMKMESFDEKGAEEAWLQSLKLKPSIWVYRNLARLYQINKNKEETFKWVKKAWEMLDSIENKSPLIIDLLTILVEEKYFLEVFHLYATLEESFKQKERILIPYAQATLELGNTDIVEKVLSLEFTSIKEGEKVLSELWCGMWELRLALGNKENITDEIKEKAKELYPLPSKINFSFLYGRISNLLVSLSQQNNPPPIVLVLRYAVELSTLCQIVLVLGFSFFFLSFFFFELVQLWRQKNGGSKTMYP